MKANPASKWDSERIAIAIWLMGSVPVSGFLGFTYSQSQMPVETRIDAQPNVLKQVSNKDHVLTYYTTGPELDRLKIIRGGLDSYDLIGFKSDGSEGTIQISIRDELLQEFDSFVGKARVGEVRGSFNHPSLEHNKQLAFERISNSGPSQVIRISVPSNIDDISIIMTPYDIPLPVYFALHTIWMSGVFWVGFLLGSLVLYIGMARIMSKFRSSRRQLSS